VLLVLLLVFTGLLLISALNRDKIIVMVKFSFLSHILAVVVSLSRVLSLVHLIRLPEL